MKRILILSLCFLTLVGCGCKNKNKENKKQELDFKVNFNVSKEKEINGLKISDIQLVIENAGLSKYSAIVTNTTDKVYNLKQINIKIVDKKGKEITTLLGYIGSNLSPGESRTINTSIEKDLTKAYDIEYEIKK